MFFNETSYYTNGDLYLDNFNQLVTKLANSSAPPAHNWQAQELLSMTFNLWVRIIHVDKIRVPKSQYQMLSPLIFDIHNYVDNHELTVQFKKTHSAPEDLFYYALFVSASLSQIFKSFTSEEVFAESNELKQYIGQEEIFFNEPKYQNLLQARRAFYQQFYYDKKLQAQFNVHMQLAYRNTCAFISSHRNKLTK